MPDTIENTSYKHIVIDNKYIASIAIKRLPEYIYFLDIIKEFPKSIEYCCSLYITKLDPIKAINDITFSIGNTNSEIWTVGATNKDIVSTQVSGNNGMKFGVRPVIEISTTDMPDARHFRK